MHITLRKSGWRFEIRIPRGIEPVFGRSAIRLNLGRLAKRRALRVARLLSGRAETVFMLCRTGAGMTEDARDNLVEESHGFSSHRKTRLTGRTRRLDAAGSFAAGSTDHSSPRRWCVLTLRRRVSAK